MPDAAFLAELNIEDLNQRYRETYIHYRGRLQWCRGFDRDGRKTYIYVENVAGDPEKGEELTGPFDHLALQVERPRSQFYKVKNRVFYLTYPTRKQFARGLSERNTVLWWPAEGRPITFGLCVKEAYNPQQIQRLRFTCKNLFASDDTEVLASPYLVFIRRDDRFNLVYRKEWLGYISENKSTFMLAKPAYKTEVAEVLVDAKIERCLEVDPRFFQLDKMVFKPKPAPRAAPRLDEFEDDNGRPMNRVARRIARDGVRNTVGLIEITPEMNFVRFPHNIYATVDTFNRVRWYHNDRELGFHEYPDYFIIDQLAIEQAQQRELIQRRAAQQRIIR